MCTALSTGMEYWLSICFVIIATLFNQSQQECRPNHVIEHNVVEMILASVRLYPLAMPWIRMQLNTTEGLAKVSLQDEAGSEVNLTGQRIGDLTITAQSASSLEVMLSIHLQVRVYGIFEISYPGSKEYTVASKSHINTELAKMNITFGKSICDIRVNEIVLQELKDFVLDYDKVDPYPSYVKDDLTRVWNERGKGAVKSQIIEQLWATERGLKDWSNYCKYFYLPEIKTEPSVLTSPLAGQQECNQVLLNNGVDIIVEHFSVEYSVGYFREFDTSQGNVTVALTRLKTGLRSYNRIGDVNIIAQTPSSTKLMVNIQFGLRLGSDFNIGFLDSNKHISYSGHAYTKNNNAQARMIITLEERICDININEVVITELNDFVVDYIKPKTNSFITVDQILIKTELARSFNTKGKDEIERRIVDGLKMTTYDLLHEYCKFPEIKENLLNIVLQ